MPANTKPDVQDRYKIKVIQRLMIRNPLRRRKKQLAAAHEWLLRLESAERIEAVWPQFETWLAADFGNRQVFLQLEEASRRMDRLNELRASMHGVNPDLLSLAGGQSEQNPTSVAMRRAWIGGTAAVLAILCLWGNPWWKLNSWNSYATVVGARRTIILSDGSSIKLNTNSELRVRLTRDSRQLVLVRGEVTFHVQHDVERPFVVTAGETIIRDIGTKFDVRRKEDGSTEILVESGRIAFTDGKRKPKTLLEGEAVRVGLRETRVDRLGIEQIKRRLAWEDGSLSFAGETLAEAVREFNRYNQVQIVIGDPQLAERQIGGTFPSNRPEEFANVLQRILGIDYTVDSSPEGGVIRLERGSGKSHGG